MDIDARFLREAMSASRGISQSKLARYLGIHHHTLRRLLRKYGISRSFANITDRHLDSLVKSFKFSRPHSGIRYARGFLRRNGVRVQRSRVIKSLRRVDGIGSFLRAQGKIRRRRYHNKRPNAVWHVDGHHKLNRWGIVIHGYVDGHDRMVCPTCCQHHRIFCHSLTL